jgi:alkanesulfonate monooxygenase SsuD/methylene tetrahydromethanopterin reductase-like flavin-dependent oxidoreductase (luciferase family)
MNPGNGMLHLMADSVTEPAGQAGQGATSPGKPAGGNGGARATRWGVLLPTFDSLGWGTPVVAAAKEAERAGFDAVWAGDHLMFHQPVLDSLCSLAAAAAVTSRPALGISVLQLALRHPVWAAKQLATIDALAPGRLRLGVGIGGEYPAEFTAAGVSRATRARRLDEIMQVLPAMLAGGPVHHDGPLAPVHTAGLRPAVSELPPVTVGGRSDAALRRAARYGDQWMGMWMSARTVQGCAEKLAAFAAEQGRPVPSIAMLVLVNVDADAAAARQGVAEFLRAHYGMPLARVERWTGYGPPGKVAALLHDYTEAGVREFVLMPAAADVLTHYQRLAAVRELVPLAPGSG